MPRLQVTRSWSLLFARGSWSMVRISLLHAVQVNESAGAKHLLAVCMDHDLRPLAEQVEIQQIVVSLSGRVADLRVSQSRFLVRLVLVRPEFALRPYTKPFLLELGDLEPGPLKQLERLWQFHADRKIFPDHVRHVVFSPLLVRG